tara:strand:+ start:459 stop:764 length:306 start_codon:yes stop_codon:yes gene_type:complete
MADKTKMILRNDPAKQRKSKCEGCGSELEFDPVDPRPVFEDMMGFINNQEQWSEHHAPSICWGMLIAVYSVIFQLAPNEKKAVQLVTDCLEEFLESDRADA